METRKVRDLTLITINEKQTMIIACDSCGGVGMKVGDTFNVPPFYVGKFAVRVALLEVLCSGAEVVTITDNICNEMDSTGNEIIKGIKEELNKANIKDIVLTGSTEENFITSSTAVGVTVIGVANNKRIKVNTVRDEALVVSIGLPKVGAEINLLEDLEIIDYTTISKLLSLDSVYEIVPVGSKGIAYEAEQLAINNNFNLYIEETIKVDIKKSGGPATCVIAAIKFDSLNKILEFIPNVNIIGCLKHKS